MLSLCHQKVIWYRPGIQNQPPHNATVPNSALYVPLLNSAFKSDDAMTELLQYATSLSSKLVSWTC